MVAFALGVTIAFCLAPIWMPYTNPLPWIKRNIDHLVMTLLFLVAIATLIWRT